MYQPHPSHRIKAYVGDTNRPTVFCGVCGKEDNEAAITEPCSGKFYSPSEETIDIKLEPK